MLVFLYHPQVFYTKSAFEMLMKNTLNEFGISPNKTPTSNNFPQLVQFGTRFYHAIENWISNDKSNQPNSKSSVRVFSLQMCLKSNIQDRRSCTFHIFLMYLKTLIQIIVHDEKKRNLNRVEWKKKKTETHRAKTTSLEIGFVSELMEKNHFICFKCAIERK